MKRFTLITLTVLSLSLAACTASKVDTNQAATQSDSVPTIVPTQTDNPALLPTLFPNLANSDDLDDRARVDEQGAVIVQASPLNLGIPADRLEFDIAMNTHSVDLSMNLAELATLTTDTGITIQPTTWNAPSGGHHVDGKLVFPSMQGGKSILEGASKLTLTIINVDAASRVFEWELK